MYRLNAIMSFDFLSQRYEREYLIFINVENDIKQASNNANQAP